MKNDDLIPEDQKIELPCGQTGFLDGCGYRCMGCFAIYGSIGCGCTNKKQELANSEVQT
ncbi:MAG: hypothetical protein R3B95_11800 [Nitrospirales bacterium]|nr:hypothetical protein [Nitrospirales bacterium]